MPLWNWSSLSPTSYASSADVYSFGSFGFSTFGGSSTLPCGGTGVYARNTLPSASAISAVNSWSAAPGSIFTVLHHGVFGSMAMLLSVKTTPEFPDFRFTLTVQPFSTRVE